MVREPGCIERLLFYTGTAELILVFTGLLRGIDITRRLALAILFYFLLTVLIIFLNRRHSVIQEFE